MHEKKLPCLFILKITCLLLTVFYTTALPGKASGAMDYLSTGVGLESREPHPEYPLKLEFTLKAGNYVAEVDVDIYQNGRKIKSIHSPGPWHYVDLEPGNYSVFARLDDSRSRGAQFTITKGVQKRVILSWPGM